MAKLTTYINQNPSDDDLLVGSEFISTNNYKTGNYKLKDLATYFSSFFIQEGTSYNLASFDQNITLNTNNISAETSKVTELQTQFTYNGTNITGVADALSTHISTTVSTATTAVATDLDKLEAVFTQDANKNVTGIQGVLSTAVTSHANSAIATASLASASSVTSLTSTVNNNTASISTNQSTIATVEGYAESRYSLKLDANGAFAGMSILASNGATSDPFSEIRFTADSFKIYNGGTASASNSYDAPFEVVNNVVKIKSANIGTVSFGDLSNVPSTFVTTVVYADNNSGSNASTTQGSRNFYALVQQSTAWSDGDSIPSGTVFNQITGSTGTNGNDAKTVKLTSSAFVVAYDAEGNNPSPSSITLTANSTNFSNGFYKFTGGGSNFTDETSFTDGSAQNQDTATVNMPASLFSTPLSFRAGVAEGGQTEVAFDTINVVAVKPGQNGFTSVLTNESHTVPAASNGNVTSYTGSGTTIVVFDGGTEYNSVTGTPGNNEFKVTAAVTSGSITIGTQTVSGNPAVFGDHSNMTTDLVIIEYTINIENTTTVKKVQTISKSKQGLTGAAGANGSAGTDARAVNLTAGDLSFEYNTSGASPSPSTVTVTATALNTTGTVYYEFFKNDVSLGTPGTANTFTYTPQASFSNMPEKIEVQIREGATNNPILARDQITMIGIKPGTDGTDGTSPYNATLSNEAHTLPTTNTGTVTYTNSGTTIDVFKGTTQLNSVTGTPGTGEFKVVATATNITAGAQTVSGNPAVFADHSAMTQNNATISYAINCENATTLTKVQSLSKSIQGDTGATGGTGATGATGARSITTHIFYSTPSTNAPTFNSSGVTYSFSTNSFSNLPTGFSNDAPEATPGSGSNNYWHIKATVVEGSPSNTITFGNVTRMFGFSGLVTFTGSSNETLTDGTNNFNYTAIDGANITTGNIASADYSYSSGNFSSDGTEISLTDGRIRSKNFAIASNGDAFFKGTITLGSTDLTESNTLNANTTKAQVGLGNVDNTSDATIQANTLAAATKADVGLGNVDNQSAATIQAGTTKANVGLGNVDDLSAADIRSGTTKANVGLGNVDNDSTATIRSVGAATSGTIAGWKLDASNIYSGSAPDASGYTTGGITLNKNGSIHSQQFYIDTSGNAFFKGALAAATGTFSGSLSAASGTFSGSLSSASGTFTGDIQVSSAATIGGTATTNDANGRPTALLLKNLGTVSGNAASVAMEMQSSSRYHHVINMTGGGGTSGSFDLNAEYRLGKSLVSGSEGDNYSFIVTKMNGGGLIIPNQTANSTTASADYSNGMSIHFNSNDASRTTSSGRLHVSEYYKTFFLDVPSAQGSSGTYQNDIFQIRKFVSGSPGSEYSLFKIDTSNHAYFRGTIYDMNNNAYYLDMNNTGDSLKVAGDVVAFVSSDKRYKDNIVNISNPLDKLNKINGVSFVWNETSHKETGKKDIGVIAQEIEEVLPEIVETRDNGYKAVDYPKLTALLIEAVKELSDKVKKLEDGITK